MEIKSKIIAFALMSMLFATGNSHATNGYAMHGIGAKSKALAGSGAAFPQDTLVMAANPAGIVQLSKRADIGAALFSPIREFDVSGGFSGVNGSLARRKTDSDSELFVVPAGGYVAPIDSNSSWGIAVFGNGGMNTDYPDFSNSACPPPPASSGTGPFCAGTAGINLSQLFITPSYARKFSGRNASWGVSLVAVAQSFEAEGIEPFAANSESPNKFSGNGADYSTGLGLRLSAMIEFMPGLTGALSVQPKINMSDFSDYKGLFAGQGSFDIPENWNFAFAWNASSSSALTFDIQHIKFSDVDSVGNSIDQFLVKGNQFGSDNGPGFGWDDMTIYKLGYQWMISSIPDWTWRVGISHADQPISDDETNLNILAPAVVETHLTAGFTKSMGSNNELSLSFMHALSESVKGTNQFDTAQEIEIEMSQYELELNYSWKF